MDLLTRQREEVRERLDGLRARTTTLEGEALNLELADAALAGVGAAPIAEARSALGLDRGPTTRTRPQRRRPARPGERQGQVLAAVRARPDGMTAPEIAKELGVGVTYVYRPLAVLTERGAIKRDGAKWAPAGHA